MVSASGNTARLRFLAASLPAPGTAAVSTRMSDAPALVQERQRSLLAEHASPADRASADTSELPTAALFLRSGRITFESRACLVVLKLASLLGRRVDARAPTSPSDATRSWSTARSASAGTPGSPIRCPHPPRRRLQALPAERGGRGPAQAAVLAPGNPGRARLAGSVDHAAALVGSMVERAPAPPAASADDIPRGRLRPSPLHPELTTTARIDSPAAARRGSRGGGANASSLLAGKKAARRPRLLPARSARRSCSRTAC